MAYRKTPKSPEGVKPKAPQVTLSSTACPEWTPPKGCAYIWLDASGAFRLGFPPLPGKTRGHSVSIPCHEGGLRQLRKVLTDRALEPEGTVATPASPIQAMLEAMGAAEAQAKREKARADLEFTKLDALSQLEELGL